MSLTNAMENLIAPIESLGGPLIEQANQLAIDAAQITEVDELNEADAVETMKALHAFMGTVEEKRLAAVRPHVDAQRFVNDTAKKLVGSLSNERTRLNRLIGDYGALLAAKQRAELAKENEERTALEQQRSDAVASAATVQEVDEINEEHSRTVAALEIKTVAELPKVTVSVKQDWEIEVMDFGELYRAHPEAVKMEPKLSVLKALASAKNGVIPGVVCKRVNNARPR